MSLKTFNTDNGITPEAFCDNCNWSGYKVDLDEDWVWDGDIEQDEHHVFYCPQCGKPVENIL